jgi:hypothetical protein
LKQSDASELHQWHAHHPTQFVLKKYVPLEQNQHDKSKSLLEHMESCVLKRHAQTEAQMQCVARIWAGVCRVVVTAYWLPSTSYQLDHVQYRDDEMHCETAIPLVDRYVSCAMLGLLAHQHGEQQEATMVRAHRCDVDEVH